MKRLLALTLAMTFLLWGCSEDPASDSTPDSAGTAATVDFAQTDTDLFTQRDLDATWENATQIDLDSAGDTVTIRDGYLLVNGVKYEEKFLHERMYRDFGPYTVPEGHYFLMGDNRNNSKDSRSGMVGPLPRDMIKGHVRCVVFPLGNMRLMED